MEGVKTFNGAMAFNPASTMNNGVLGDSSTVKRFFQYRCIDPVATTQGAPWYRITDYCPCDPTVSNPSGRGFVSCPVGVQFGQGAIAAQGALSAAAVPATPTTTNGLVWGPGTVEALRGAMYSAPGGTGAGAMAVPTILETRPVYRIGYEWRSFEG